MFFQITYKDFSIQAVLAKWKKAEEPEKTKLLNRLKELTKIKKELESML